MLDHEQTMRLVQCVMDLDNDEQVQAMRRTAREIGLTRVIFLLSREVLDFDDRADELVSWALQWLESGGSGSDAEAAKIRQADPVVSLLVQALTLLGCDKEHDEGRAAAGATLERVFGAEADAARDALEGDDPGTTSH